MQLGLCQALCSERVSDESIFFGPIPERLLKIAKQLGAASDHRLWGEPTDTQGD